jgi:acetyl esterase/lipase
MAKDTVIREIVFKRIGGRALKLDLYLPTCGGIVSPLVIWVGGGGWKQMGKAGCERLAAWLTGHGFAVAGVEYRVSGEAIFPAQIQDCKAAVRWLRAHATEYGLDEKRVGAWGDSAGGHLVELLSTTSGVAEFEADGVYPEQSSAIQACCSFYGPSDLTDLPAASELVAQLLGCSVEECPEVATKASPITYVSSSSAPHLLVHGDADVIVPISHSYRFLAALEEHGVDAKLHVRHGVGHDGEAFYGNADVRSLVVGFFRTFL